MDSIIKRKNSIIYSFPTISLIIRLIPVIFFSWILFDFASSTQPEFSSNDMITYKLKRYFAHNEKFIVRFAILGILSVISLLSILSIIRSINLEYKDRISAEIAHISDFKFQVKTRNKPYILILRPFGSDGNLFVRKTKSVLSRLFNPVVGNTTIEQIVADKVKTEKNWETVAVVDPNSDVVASGPNYVSCSENWHPEVHQLVCDSSAVIFIFPPGSKITASLQYEIDLCSQYREDARLVFIFPPSNLKHMLNVDEIINAISSFSDAGDQMEKLDIDRNDILAIVDGKTTLFWYEMRWQGVFKYIQHSNEKIYLDFFDNWIKYIDGKENAFEIAKTPTSDANF